MVKVFNARIKLDDIKILTVVALCMTETHTMNIT